MGPPLQQALDGDGQACLSVGVDDLAALSALEQGIVAPVVSFPHSTAVGTPFGRVVGIHPVQRNTVVEAAGLVRTLEIG